MRRARSMEDLVILPEEAKMAASLLRLTLSEKMETSKPDTEFQSYMRTNNQFPYHRTILIADVRPEPVVVEKASQTSAFMSACLPSGVNTAKIQRRRRHLKQRCDSSPSAISHEESKPVKDTSKTATLSQSAPSEGFFNRLFPSFLRRRFSKETQEKEDAKPVAPTVVTAATPAKVEPFPEISQSNKTNNGHFVRQFVRMESNMDNFIFMSMR